MSENVTNQAKRQRKIIQKIAYGEIEIKNHIEKERAMSEQLKHTEEKFKSLHEQTWNILSSNKILRKEMSDMKMYLESRGIISDFYEYVCNISNRETEVEDNQLAIVKQQNQIERSYLRDKISYQNDGFEME